MRDIVKGLLGNLKADGGIDKRSFGDCYDELSGAQLLGLEHDEDVPFMAISR